MNGATQLGTLWTSGGEGLKSGDAQIRLMEATRASAVWSNGSDQLLSYYSLGTIGALTELHAKVYYEVCGFNRSFEIFVARELSDFIEGFDPECDGFWVYKRGEKIIGAVAIDGSESDATGARLRFLIVDSDCQKQGIGRLLVQTAIDFCRSKSMNHIFIMTNPQLKQARTLYEQFGFQLTAVVRSDWWGVQHLHQRFDLFSS